MFKHNSQARKAGECHPNHHQSKALPDSSDKEKIAAAAKTLSLFGAMVHSSFGNLVEDDWVQDIHNFCSNYRALPGTTS